MITSKTDEQPTDSWAQNAKSLLLIGAGISFGVTFWLAVFGLVALLWLRFQA